MQHGSESLRGDGSVHEHLEAHLFGEVSDVVLCDRVQDEVLPNHSCLSSGKTLVCL